MPQQLTVVTVDDHRHPRVIRLRPSPSEANLAGTDPNARLTIRHSERPGYLFARSHTKGILPMYVRLDISAPQADARGDEQFILSFSRMGTHDVS